MATKRRHATRRASRDRRSLVLLTGMVALLLLLASGALWLFAAGGGGRLNAGRLGGPFALVAGDGAAVTDRSFAGKYLLIYFGYTECRDVCPTTLTAVADALDVLGRRADAVQPLFITLDPARDTPTVVRRYAQSFSPRLMGLTGSEAAIRRAAAAFRVASLVHTGATPDDYTLDHTSVLFLVRPDGRSVVPIRADLAGGAMAREIARGMS